MSTPKGYCPGCGYQIDPGVCPECGEVVDASAIRRSELPSKLRQLWNRPFLVGGVISCLLGSVLFFNIVDWVAFVPTPVLLWLQGHERTMFSQELDRRFLNGKLSAGQFQEMFEKSTMLKIEIRGPCPADTLLFAHGRLSTVLPSDCEISLDEWALNIDGRRLDEGLQPPYVSHDSPQLRRLRYDLMSLSTGKHRIQIVQTVSATQLSTLGQGTAPTVSIQLSVDSEIDVVESPPAVLLRGDTGADLVDRLRKFWRVSCIDMNYPPTPRGYVVSFTRMSEKIPLAGSVWIRMDGESDFRRVGTIVQEGENFDQCGDVFIPNLGSAEAAKSLDVRFVPDYSLAFGAGLESCFAGTVEWDAVPIENGSRPSQDSAEKYPLPGAKRLMMGPEPQFRAPSRIIMPTTMPADAEAH